MHGLPEHAAGQALKLVAQKLQFPLAVEGDLPEDGLAAYGDDGDDLIMALARQLVSGEYDEEPAEDICLEAQKVAAEADRLLVHADWERVEPAAESLVLPPLSDGHVQQVTEMLPWVSHHGQKEQQHTMFSWAELLAEQWNEPNSQGRNPRPAGPSLFEWTLEREQQAEPAAAAG